MKVEVEIVKKGRRYAGVYIIYNKISKKFYIGSTINYSSRKYQHLQQLKNNIHDNRYLQKAWNKYGELSFVFGLILKYKFIDFNYDDIYKIVRDKEQFYIDKFNACTSGYNICYCVESRNQPLNKIVQFSLNGHLINIWDNIFQIEKELNILNISGIRNCCNPNGKNLTANGYIWVYYKDYIKNDFNINDKLLSNIPINSISVVQFDFNGNLIKIWDCITDAFREYNYNQHNISECCSNKRRNANGFIWMYYSDYISCDFEQILKDKIIFNNTKYIDKKKTVEQYDLNDNLIRVWDCAKQADKEGGFNYKNISACCLGQRKTHKGFKWKFIS